MENAPYGSTVDPKFTINSEDESKSKINVEPVTITGKSVEGTISDEKGTLYEGIELKLTKNEEEVKRTYSKENGKYVFSLGDTEGYQISLAEEKYQVVRYEEETTDENRRVLNLVIKEVEPFNLSVRKTISKLDLVVNGNKQSYTYDDASVVSKSVKGAKTIEGSIYYNIYIKNSGEVKGTLAVLKDALPDGLSFDESKNPGWTKEGKYLFYTPLEGKEIEPFGKEKVTLVLVIVKTNEAKTYINTINANGEDYKYVVYYLNNNVYKEEYVINSEKVEDINPNVENFDGWYTDRNYTNKYDFKLPVTKDTILFGKIANNKYNVSFIDVNPNNNQETVLDIVEVNEGDSVDLIDHPEYRGYTFKCFKLYNRCYDNEEITDDVNLYTSYTIDEYEIDYDLDGGSVSESNPDRYTVNDEIELHNPIKQGHTFNGWYGTDLSELTLNVTIPRGSIGNREYIANYEINRSSLTVNPNGGLYEGAASNTVYTEDYGTIKHINDSERTGYNFTGYTHTGGGTFNNGTYTFDDDDAELTANYEIITYDIHYENITDAEREALRNPIHYDVETETFTLREPETRVDGDGNPSEDFIGWDDGSGTASKNITIPKGSTGNKTYTAVWRQNGKEYEITYELNGGTLSNPNPNTYTRASESITLNNPTKNGYRFVGWAGTDLIGDTNQVVTIPKGSAGDRHYVAHYELIEYTIEYNGLLPTEDLGNPIKYTIESDNITLVNPSRTGYNFLGWTGSNGTTPGNVTIPHGSIGDREYTVNFELIEYSLTYTLNGGAYESGKTNPPKYTIESGNIKLNNPTKEGYNFIGWTGTGVDTPVKDVIIPTGSIGHRSFLANYEPIVYTITYDYGEGSLPTGVTNPGRYTIESDEITFNNPVREGYNFTNYTENGNIITSIPTGSMGNKSLLAHYEIKKFNVKYYNESILYHTDEVDWGTTTTAPVTNPTKAHNIFLYWSEDGTNSYAFDTTIVDDKNLYAVYEEVLAPEITISPELDDLTNRTWVCNNSSNADCGVTVTITSDHNEYELYYKIGDGEAQLYTGPFKVYENTTITAFSKKSNIYSEEVSSEVTNVDSIAPTINQPATGSMSFNMTVSGTAQDAGSGVKEFTLYVKEKDALLWDDTLTYETNTFDGIRDHAENYDHTFYGVTDNTEYIIKIVAEDYVGNISELEVEVVTHPYVARVVGKNGILWYTVDPDTKEFVIDDDKEFLLFDSIQAAVDYCAGVQCTIQTNPIMPVVNESVIIAENQNITIDLDGRGITSNENATFVNNGKLQIVDRNPRMNGEEHESIGFVKNTENKGIINNNILIIGDGSSEASETFIYPELDRPIIEGKTTAIEQNREFHFYDGKIKSDVLAITDNGDDVITQYSYNVIILTEDEQNVATMDRVRDPEARIRSTYYAKLNINNAADAFNSSRTGTLSTEESKMLSKIKQAGDYGFIYDAVNNLIYSGNSSTANTTAKSYLKIDLTDYNEDQLIAFDTFADTFNSNTYGTVTVSESLNDPGTQIYRGTGNDVKSTRVHCLEKGKVHYIFFNFIKANGNIDVFEKFVISNFRILGEREEYDDIKLYNDFNYYAFEKDSNENYSSTNTSDYSYSHSYAVFDLRGETEPINLILKTSISGRPGADYGYVYLSDNTNFQEYNNTNGRYVLDSGEVSERVTAIPLTPGILNYVHFGYYHRDRIVGDNKFTINSIGFYKGYTGNNIALSTDLNHNSTDNYYFAKGYDPFYWKAQVGPNATIYGATLNETNDGFNFDGNDSVIINNGINTTTLTSETVELEFSTTVTNDSVYYMGSNKEKISIGLWSNELVVANISSNKPFRYILPSEWYDGNKHKVTVVCNEGVYDAYFDDTLMTKSTTVDSYTGGLNASTYVGALSNGYGFNGTIYSVKVYDRALSEDEILGSTTEGLIFNLDGSDPKISVESYISNNREVSNSKAHSYIKLDLTNINEDKFLYVNTKISSQLNSDFGYVLINDSPDYPSDLSTASLKVSGDLDNQSAILGLKKNKVNYVHFIYTKDGSRNDGNDSFIIKEIKYCNTLEDAYSINSDSYSNIDSIYFEKPILNTEVDTIEILKNITLDTPIVVPQEKEVVLDLNGFTLTSNKDDYVIKNNGKLTITDSEYNDRHSRNLEYHTEQARLFEEAKTQYFADLDEYEEYAGLCDGCEPSDEYVIDTILDQKDYDYTGGFEEFITPYTGNYKIELWGAKGGNNNDDFGNGGYTSGIVNLTKGDTLYIYVGSKGGSTRASISEHVDGGYNGGGDTEGQSCCGRTYGTGGGATDVRYFNSIPSSEDMSVNSPLGLKSRIMVAAGGGGGFNGSGGGNAGGLVGQNGATNNGYGPGGGATQLSGGINTKEALPSGSFGIGGSRGNYGLSTGGGGGYYGGAGSHHIDAAGGGSSYISGHPGSIAIISESSLSPRLDSNGVECTAESAINDSLCSIHYSGKSFTNTIMKAGNEEMPSYDGDDTTIGNKDDGHARIQISLTDEEKEYFEELKNNLEKTYSVKKRPNFPDYLSEIDINSDDINSIEPDSDLSYNDTASEDVYGSITSTINNVILNEEYAYLAVNAANINVDANNRIAIVNRGTLALNNKAIINTYKNNTIGIFNESNGNILNSSGIINVSGNNSIGLLNRSNDSEIKGLRIVTNVSNNKGLNNEALSDVTLSNLDISGAGIAYREYSSGNVLVLDSNFKSTNNYSFVNSPQGRNGNVTINSSSFNGQFTLHDSPKVISVNNSNLTTIFNHFGYLLMDNSTLTKIDNRGEAIVSNTTFTGNDTLILNYSQGSPGSQSYSKLTLKDSIVNSQATSNDMAIINNYDTLNIIDTKINNVGSYKPTAIKNNYRSLDPGWNAWADLPSHLNIYGNTEIDSSFGTAINNDSILNIGSKDKYNIEYNYAYTGKQEVFTAPETGTYKLETWGASGGESYRYLCGMGSCTGSVVGGKGGYASGTINLNAGDKLYIHVGQVGSSGTRGDGESFITAAYGIYNGGGALTGSINSWPSGSGGGATDISLSDEDNVWSYDNGLVSNRRSIESYEQRILVAGGGSAGERGDSNRYGGYEVDPSTSQLGYSIRNGGGGYYGGKFGEGGSSYASSMLSDTILINGRGDMPDYYGSGKMTGNYGNGYAKITLLDSNVDTVTTNPTISATNYGITGAGTTMFYDGTISAKKSVNTSIDYVPDDYDIYIKYNNDIETMNLVANANSRPVEQGEEEFVAAIGNAKYTTIQNALDASNNGDTIVILTDIDQQNNIEIASEKIITIDYNGHSITTYSGDYLFNNAGTLTIKDSKNAKTLSKFYGDRYILNTGTLNLNDIYLDNYIYSSYMIENMDGTINMDNIKVTFASHGESNKYGIYNSENGTMNITNSEFRAFGNNRMFTNYGLLTIKDTPLISNNSAPLVQNNEQGTAILDNTDLRHENAHNNFGMYLIENYGTATIKNLTDDIFSIPNYGVLTLENNTFSAGTINSEGLLIIDSGTYRNTFNVRKTGKPIDNTGDLYSFIMHDGTINTKINREGTGITNIEGGIINVTNDVAINNSGSGVINLGIHDNSADTKENTRPIITGKTYGIYTSNPSLKVNFYDGIVTGQKSYNVTIESIETGYSIKREYDETNDIETKYLTNEPMFINVTQDIMYNSIDEFNNALTNNLVNDLDVIKVYRDITITNLETEITIPNGLSITFDLNGKVIDKNNKTLFINNGTLTVIDSEDSTGIIDSTLGNIFINNGTLSISSGKFTSEQAPNETEVIKNNENATLNISGGTFTKYYDNIDYRLTKSGSIINNDGNATITNGKFVTNGSYVVEGPGANYFSNVFLNNTTGILNVTGGEYDGINGKLLNHERWENPNASFVNLGSLIYNSGTATIKDITANQSLIGENSGTLSFDNLTMNHIVQITHNRYGWIHGSNHNVINTGTLNFDNSNFEIYNSFIENRGGVVTINNTIIDKINDGIRYSDVDTSDHLQKNLHVIRNKANSSVTIIDSEIYNRGSGEVIDNFSTITITDSTLESAQNNTLKGSGSSYDIKDSIITSGRDAAINVSSSSTVKVTGNSTVTSASSIGVNINNSTAIIGEPISIDGTVSQTYPAIKGATYAVANTNGTFNFYDGKLYGKTAPFNGVTSAIEDGYAIVLGVEDDYQTAILDRIPIVKNVTKSISEDVVYYDLKTAFNEASSGDTLQMVANYNNLPTDETAINNENVTFDLNGFFIKQANSVLIENNGTLRIVDSSQNKTGMIIAVSGDMTFENNGTIIHSSGKIESQLGVLLFNNNSGASLTIKDEATVNSLKSNKLINNNGTLNIYNGAYLHNTGGTLITNNSLLNIIDLNNDDDSDTSSTLTAPWLYSEGNGVVILDSEYNNASIITSVGSTTNIYGGIFNNGNNNSPTYSTITKNAGTMNIKYLHSYAGVIGYNSGTLNINDSHFYNSKTGFLNSTSGILNMNNTDIDITEYDGFVLDGNKDRMWLGKTSMNNVNITSKDNISYAGRAIVFKGETIVTDSTFSLYVRNDDVIINEATTTFENVNTTAGNTIGNGGKLTLNSSTITSSSEAVISSGTLIVDNESTITATGGNAITTTGTVEVKNRSNVISNNGIGIQLNNQAKLTLGEIGGVPDRELPYVEGSTYGVYRNTQTSQFNFYDGLIVGQSGPNAIYGGLTDVESGYETEDTIITDPETSIAKHNEYLVVSATSVAVAKVGTYSFASVGSISPSMALQNAINFAIGDGTSVKSVDLISDIDLVNDQYSVTASMPVTINLNGKTINQNSSYYLDSNISLNTNSLGGNVSKFLSDVFDLSFNPKNIIIYELNDGSKLDTTQTYTLYRDGKVLSLEKEEFGKYRYQGDNDTLIPIKGRLYIDNLQKGSYRLESSDNKYIEFDIDSDGNISGNVVENTNSSNSSSAVAKSEAELILSIQTGIERHSYLLFIIPITFIIILLMIINKNKKREIN